MSGKIYPTIVVPGIGQSKTALLDDNGKVIKIVWPIRFDMKAFKKALGPHFIAMALFRHDLGFSMAVANELARQLGDLSCDRDGNEIHHLEPVSYPNSFAECTDNEKGYIRRMLPADKLCSTIGEENFYFFTYNSFGNTIKIVNSLRKYIKTVKEKTGSDKVNLMPVSLGGTVTTAYFDYFGDDCDVNKVVGIVPAYDGSVLVPDLMTDNIKKDYSELFTVLLGKGQSREIMKVINKLPKKVVDKTVSEALRALVYTVFLNSPMAWGAMPVKYYKKLEEDFLKDASYDGLKKIADRTYKLRTDFKSFIEKQRERGVEFYTLCGYNLRMFPVFMSSDISSDTIVQTESCSMGAYILPLGETFPQDYKQKNVNCSVDEHNHISPDRTVDASVGAVPESTWYFKDMDHEGAAKNEKLLDLAAKLLHDDDIKTVFDDENYPQFN